MIAINPNNNQQTIEDSIFIKGIGLHSGKDVELKLDPAEVDNGIKFILAFGSGPISVFLISEIYSITLEFNYLFLINYLMNV